MRKSYGERLDPEYTICGLNKSEKYPYVIGLKSLKEAVKVAVNYNTFEPNGACTRIKRNFNFRSLDNPEGHISGLSHEWYIFPNGKLVLSRKLMFSNEDLDDWVNHFPSPPQSLKDLQSLQSELWDLERIADRLGYKDAHSYLFKARWSRISESNQRRHNEAMNFNNRNYACCRDRLDCCNALASGRGDKRNSEERKNMNARRSSKIFCIMREIWRGSDPLIVASSLAFAFVALSLLYSMYSSILS